MNERDRLIQPGLLFRLERPQDRGEIPIVRADTGRPRLHEQHELGSQVADSVGGDEGRRIERAADPIVAG